jgi:hypothetical protein
MKITKKSMVLLGLMFASGVHAETLPGMMVNFSSSYPGIWKLMYGATYLIGLLLVCSSIFSWVRVVDGRSQTKMAVPISQFIIGSALYQFSNAFKMVEDTFAMTHNANILNAAGVSGSGMAGWSAGAIAAVLGFVQILGFIAFVRGWLLLHKYNTGEARDGLGRGITHIVGGVLSVNVRFTVETLANTFAPGMVGTFRGIGLI